MVAVINDVILAKAPDCADWFYPKGKPERWLSFPDKDTCITSVQSRVRLTTPSKGRSKKRGRRKAR